MDPGLTQVTVATAFGETIHLGVRLGDPWDVVKTDIAGALGIEASEVSQNVLVFGVAPDTGRLTQLDSDHTPLVRDDLLCDPYEAGHVIADWFVSAPQPKQVTHSSLIGGNRGHHKSKQAAAPIDPRITEFLTGLRNRDQKTPL